MEAGDVPRCVIPKHSSWEFSPSLKAEDTRRNVAGRRIERRENSPSSIICSMGSSAGWVMPTHIALLQEFSHTDMQNSGLHPAVKLQFQFLCGGITTLNFETEINQDFS